MSAWYWFVLGGVSTWAAFITYVHLRTARAIRQSQRLELPKMPPRGMHPQEQRAVMAKRRGV